ncbi:hypothetical protein BO71DRAFT_11105 [Aspergillus ellipticus CBS 707.79]|uniref:Uncharacterized protein n=1 Tax=Aspergillus ellipticus CBS 707.79 TaxID=1448320 RepID=A0A319D6C4_9EURO|nr:hypothetical protein BO71DRAFT_11105 [Aspergillus ellipticus CBS 707.79]
MTFGPRGSLMLLAYCTHYPVPGCYLYSMWYLLLACAARGLADPEELVRLHLDELHHLQNQYQLNEFEAILLACKAPASHRERVARGVSGCGCCVDVDGRVIDVCEAPGGVPVCIQSSLVD